MGAILLTILKIIGIILLVVLGLILLIVATILVAAVRYEVRAASGGQPDNTHVTAKVGWLFDLLRLRFRWQNGQLQLEVKALFFTIFKQMPPPASKAPAAEPPETAAKPPDTAAVKADAAAPPAEATESSAGPPAGEPPAAADDACLEARVKELSAELEREEKERRDEEKKTVDTARSGPETEFLEETVRPDPETASLDEAVLPANRPEPAAEAAAGPRPEAATGPTVSVPPKKKSAADRFQKIKCTFENIYAKINTLIEQKDKVLDFVNDPVHRRALRALKNGLLKLLRRLKPKRFRLTARVGFTDPATTGTLLAAYSTLAPWIMEQVQLEPVFDEKALAGRLYVKGRLRLGYFLLLAGGLLLKKDVRKTVRDGMKFKL